MAPDLHKINLQDSAIRHHFYIQMAKKNVSAPAAASAPDGLPVISLPNLVLLKMRAGRAIDIGDLSRVLGAADDATLAETRRAIQNELADGEEDLEGLIYLGRLECGQIIRE